MNKKIRHYTIAIMVVSIFFLSLPNSRVMLMNFVNGGWKDSVEWVKDSAVKTAENVSEANRRIIQGEERKEVWNGSSWVRNIMPGSKYGAVYEVKLLRVIDGDTIDVQYNGRVERVRLADIDTFETHDNNKMAQDARSFGTSKNVLYQAGLMAKSFVERVLPTGTDIGLSFPNDRIKRGKYNRLIAYVHLSNGSILNSVLIRKGLARTYGGAYAGWNRMVYKALEVKVRASKIGVWKTIN